MRSDSPRWVPRCRGSCRCSQRQRADTVASAIRITEPVHRAEVEAAVERFGGEIVSVGDDEIVDAWRSLAREEGVFCEPASAAGIAGLAHGVAHGGERVVCVAHRPRPEGSCGGGAARPVTIRVRAPATTANLGPGFDCAAVALDLWNELELSPDGPAPDPDHLAVRAFALVAPPDGHGFAFTDRIPRERGLGSSAATIALGLVAGANAAGREPDPEELLALGTPLEGHADNLAAALAGGVCLTWDGRIARVADTHAGRADRRRADHAREHGSRTGGAAGQGAARGRRLHCRPCCAARRGARARLRDALRRGRGRPDPRALPGAPCAAAGRDPLRAAGRLRRLDPLRLRPDGDRLGRAGRSRRLRRPAERSDSRTRRCCRSPSPPPAPDLAGD